MEFDNIGESEMELFIYKNSNVNNIIVKNSKTHVYECFDKNGNIEYKLILVKKEKNVCYFKLANEKYIIKYEVDTKNLYKMTIDDYYGLDDSNNTYFDNKTIII
jgi:hypothetical protein